MTDLSVRKIIQTLIVKTKLVLFFRYALISFCWAMAIFMLARLLGFETGIAAPLFLIVWLSLAFYLGHLKAGSKVSDSALVEYLNRINPKFEESAQLLLEHQDSLNLLQKIQKQRIQELLKDNYQSRQLNLPSLNFILVFKHLVGSFSFVFLSYLFIQVISLWQSHALQNGILLEQSLEESIVIDSVNIQVIPPGYTESSEVIEKELSFKVIEGSEVNWKVVFSRPELEYFLIPSDRENKSQELAFIKNAENEFYLKQTVNKTLLYSIGYRRNGESKRIPGIYSITVLRDKPPKVKIIEPNRSLVEFSKDDNGKFDVQALVTDDFGIGEVKILASVAKGSGEAVKFRDESFDFDSRKKQAKGSLFQRSFVLKDLQMEPGDEVYFSVVAVDNKQPEPQRTKSSSVIVRWLDDEIEEIGAEGIQIHFVPEYFRSQRQIIIETEQLIADRKELNQIEIDDKSRDLGHSQRDLKEKYGQYLGDEFGEGPGEHFGLADGYHGGEDIAAGEATAGMEEHDEHDDHDDHGEEDHMNDDAHADEGYSDSHDHGPEVGHLHDDMVDHSDKSGASQLIARFAHNHGSADIGPMSRRDPKSWMKKAVSIMWQAELHLMMSEPEKALPYEYEAYEYLKLAREADRVYVKRLGFEPPPVKESARLTGELNEILTYDLVVDEDPQEQSDSLMFKQAHHLLTYWQPTKKLESAHQQLLRDLAARLLELSENRPALVSHAATVENILLNQKLELTGCSDCLDNLRRKLWQLLPAAISEPQVRSLNINQQNEAHKKYLSRAQELTQNLGESNE